MEKSKMADMCLENNWRTTLAERGWSSRSIEQFLLHWAPSTLALYNRQIKKFALFCVSSDCVFPTMNECILSAFMCSIADSSPRPKSQLNSTVAALTCLCNSLDITNPWTGTRMKILVNSLVKSSTSLPMTKTPVMPIQPFTDLFGGWSSNDNLSLKCLRLKTLCLLALVLMLRPSDVAVKSQGFDSELCVPSQMVFSEHQVTFNPDGTLSVCFHGIKNDYDRDGFVVTIPPASSEKLDPVSCLQEYMLRTESIRQSIPDLPVFITLTKPYRAMSASSISAVLHEAIVLSGLDSKHYTPKCFRPTGATQAISVGTDPNIARHIGRWRSQEVFEKHYVHSKVDSSYTDSIFRC